MSAALTLLAPAKVNFRLDVLKRRADGYHDLRMLMQRIALWDEIEIRLTDKPGITVSSDSANIPEGSENIVWKAANAILSKTNIKAGVNINITKRIPVAAGLGGGSSDAATTLMGLNQLLSLGFSSRELIQTGLTIGADVPFFIFQKPAIAEGIGEILTPVEKIPKLWLLLVKPGIEVSTRWAFQNLNLETDKFIPLIPIKYESIADVCSILHNDLESVTMKQFPVVSEIKDQLIACGASGALMSGSGATLFAIFPDETTAKKAASNLTSNSEWFIATVATI